MGTLTADLIPLAASVHCSDDELVVSLKDGRIISVPLAWFPRLAHAAQSARTNYEILGNGEGIHWPDLDEDISIIGLLAGRASVEYNQRGSRLSPAADR